MKVKKKSLAPWLVAVVLGVVLMGGIAKANNVFSWDSVMEKVADRIASKITDLEEVLGASGTRFDNGLSADSTSPVAGELRGTTLTITGASSLSGTSTLGYTPNQLNTPQTAFNGNSTTLCSVQNTSGVSRIISALTIASTGSTGNGVATGWRGYVSAARADNNRRATGTLFSESQLGIAATDVQVWGGPVPNSYYVSTTAAAFLTVGNLTTSTPVLWPNNWYANVTSTAISSSTGNCSIHSYPL